MKYLIQRMDHGGGYVTPSGSEKTHTRNPVEARHYVSREQAERCRCVDSEIIVPLNEAVQL